MNLTPHSGQFVRFWSQFSQATCPIGQIFLLVSRNFSDNLHKEQNIMTRIKQKILEAELDDH